MTQERLSRMAVTSYPLTDITFSLVLFNYLLHVNICLVEFLKDSISRYKVSILLQQLLYFLLSSIFHCPSPQFGFSQMQECNQAALGKNFYFYEQRNQHHVDAGILLSIQWDTTPYVQGISVWLCAGQLLVQSLPIVESNFQVALEECPWHSGTFLLFEIWSEWLVGQQRRPVKITENLYLMSFVSISWSHGMWQYNHIETKVLQRNQMHQPQDTLKSWSLTAVIVSSLLTLMMFLYQHSWYSVLAYLLHLHIHKHEVANTKPQFHPSLQLSLVFIIVQSMCPPPPPMGSTLCTLKLTTGLPTPAIYNSKELQLC